MFLAEIKSAHPFSTTGFKFIRSKIIEGEELRGGVAVLFKDSISDNVHDVLEKDQVWFSLLCALDFRIRAVYIAPRDSPFFTIHIFSVVHEQITKPYKKALVMGDINARIPHMDTSASTRCGLTA